VFNIVFSEKNQVDVQVISRGGTMGSWTKVFSSLLFMIKPLVLIF